MRFKRANGHIHTSLVSGPFEGAVIAHEASGPTLGAPRGGIYLVALAHESTATPRLLSRPYPTPYSTVSERLDISPRVYITLSLVRFMRGC